MIVVSELGEVTDWPPSEVIVSPSARPACEAGEPGTTDCDLRAGGHRRRAEASPTEPIGTTAGGDHAHAEEGRRADMHRRGRVARGDLARDLQRGGDRYGEALGRCGPALLEGEPRRGRGVHADHLPAAVHQRAAGVARLDVSVGLDEAGEVLGGSVALVARGDGLAEGDHAAARVARSPAASSGVADPDDCFAGANARGVPEADRLETRSTLELHHGDVARAVVADELGAVGLLIAHIGHPYRGCTLNNVIVRENLPVEVSTMPVPAASSFPFKVTLMSTSPESTRLATEEASTRPPEPLEPEEPDPGTPVSVRSSLAWPITSIGEREPDGGTIATSCRLRAS